MFISNKHLKELIRDEISKKFKEVGFDYHYNESPIYYPSTQFIFEPLEVVRHRFEKLLEHLGLEYYKMDITETNGKIKYVTQEGFRKIKKVD